MLGSYEHANRGGDLHTQSSGHCAPCTAVSAGQTHPPEAVFIVCDGCDDGTQEAARAVGDPRVVVLDKPKAPGAGWLNRNDVLEQADAEVVAWLSDDDLWLPTTWSGSPPSTRAASRISCSRVAF